VVRVRSPTAQRKEQKKLSTTEVKRLNWVALGLHIKDYRSKRGLSQRQFAKMIGRQQPDLCHFERGTQQFTVEALANVADVMREDLSSFMAILLTASEENSMYESEACEILEWTLKKLQKNRDALRAFKSSTGRWLYPAYEVYRVARREKRQLEADY